MNQEIKAAVARTSTMPPEGAGLPEFFEELIDGPHTLATVSAALATCPHPMRCQVDGTVHREGESEELVWCAACGAMAVGAPALGQVQHWERPALVQQFQGEQFEALAGAKQTLGQAMVLVGLELEPLHGQRLTDREVLAGAIRDVLTLAIFREMARTEGARKVLGLREKLSLVELCEAAFSAVAP